MKWIFAVIGFLIFFSGRTQTSSNTFTISKSALAKMDSADEVIKGVPGSCVIKSLFELTYKKGESVWAETGAPGELNAMLRKHLLKAKTGSKAYLDLQMNCSGKVQAYTYTLKIAD